MTYDPGSSGALSYLEAAREIAERGALDQGTTPPTTNVRTEYGDVRPGFRAPLLMTTEREPPRRTVSEKRRGLGRGLGALIPTGLDGQR